MSCSHPVSLKLNGIDDTNVVHLQPLNIADAVADKNYGAEVSRFLFSMHAHHRLAHTHLGDFQLVNFQSANYLFILILRGILTGI